MSYIKRLFKKIQTKTIMYLQIKFKDFPVEIEFLIRA